MGGGDLEESLTDNRREVCLGLLGADLVVPESLLAASLRIS